MSDTQMSDTAVKSMIPLSEPHISGNEWKYLKECLDSGWVSSDGSYVSRFEEMVAKYVRSPYSVATVNGTSALHVSLMTCGVQPGDEVMVPALTFIAPVNTVRYCGAAPVFMDCEGDTLCLDTEKVIEFVRKGCKSGKDGYTCNRESGSRVKGIIPVHVFGHPVDMDPLLEICREHNIDIIEDATESLGSIYKGSFTGTLGKAGCFSFNGNKIITTGGGGMIVTGDEEIARRARHVATQAKSDAFEYDHDEIGYNYRLTNIQAAMGVAQLERLEEFVEIKRRNAELYGQLLEDLEGVETVREREWARSNFWLCTIRVPAMDRKPLMGHLLSRGIQVRPVWRLVNTLPMYKGYQSYKVEEAVRALQTCVSLPSSVGLKREQIELVANAIRAYFQGKR